MGQGEDKNLKAMDTIGPIFIALQVQIKQICNWFAFKMFYPLASAGCIYI